jgi:putative transposase
MTEEEKRKIALFRFGVIAELVSRTDLSWGEQERKIREFSEREWEIPGSQRSRVARSTIHEWLQRYERSGRRIESLFPQDRSDSGKARSIDEETELALVNLKGEMPRMTLPSLLSEARRRHLIGAEFHASAQSLYRMFKRHGLNDEGEQEGERRRFEAEYPNELWQADCMHGPRVVTERGGHKKAFLFGLIDDHSRLIPHAQFYLQENIDGFQHCLVQAFEKRGLPRKLFVDNGPSFRSERLRYGCAALGVALIYTRPYSAASKGKIERLWRTVRMQLLPRLNEELTLQELNQRLWDWIEKEYHLRVHGSTGMAPLKRFLQHIELIRPAPKDLRDYFRKPEYRNVDRNTRTVSLNGKLYEAPAGLAGKRVLLLYHEQDPERVEVIYDNHSQGFLTPLNPQVNARVRRTSGRDIDLVPRENQSPEQNDKADPRRYRGGELFDGGQQS